MDQKQNSHPADSSFPEEVGSERTFESQEKLLDLGQTAGACDDKFREKERDERSFA